ncbi:hypothetical protein CFHF_13095 [Caulobacter flavus]|uniref:DUF2806 domain-containing protein n=1 Tax=Caulobacter flavus TaxID=1679497 RepID=A0A2N5CTB3_9CAUL|nr:DUF2806 domain-containing protein [Caulobacter flavus]AYV49249.1 hypothetical protein C1707_25040 [Caulobacter flavus]PLR14895.1 hypothetical protein CFHF_13095 [Caulobacter flavus]
MTDVTALAQIVGGYAATIGGMAVAKDAIQRVIGVGLDFALAPFEDAAQGIKDKRAARTAVSQARATAVAKQLNEDPALVERAAESLLRKEVKRQRNREAIAAKAAEEILADPPKGDAPVDEDWLDLFSSYAERATKDEVQAMWGRILAGEIRSPGNFSRATLRFLAEVETDIAELFNVFVKETLSGSWLGRPGMRFSALDEVGLTVSDKSYRIEPDAPICFQDNGWVLELSADIKLSCPVLLLSRLGTQLASLIEKPSEEHRIRENIERLRAALSDAQKPHLHAAWGRQISEDRFRKEFFA